MDADGGFGRLRSGLPLNIGHNQIASACLKSADCVEKFLFADDLKFSGPLVRLSSCEVRDHIN